jgi:hypothetical protein
LVKTLEQQAVKLLVDTIGFIHRLSRIEWHTSNNALTGSYPSRPFSSTQPAAPLPPLLSPVRPSTVAPRRTTPNPAKSRRGDLPPTGSGGWLAQVALFLADRDMRCYVDLVAAAPKSGPGGSSFPDPTDWRGA